MSEQAVRDSLVYQGEACSRHGSPFNGLVLQLIAAKLSRNSEVGKRVLDWPDPPQTRGGAAIGLRLTGALHALALSGRMTELTEAWPPNPTPDLDTLWRAITLAFAFHGDFILERLKTPPQSNDVGRAGALMTGLKILSQMTGGLPMALYDLGAAAGLNLNLDLYGYDLGGTLAGDPASPVQLAPDWHGEPAPDAPVTIVEKHGVDIEPLSAGDAAAADILLSFVWPDDIARMQRQRAALELARPDPPVIDRGDAADWLEARLAIEPQSGTLRVVQTAIAFQYFSPDSQRRVRDHLRRAGQAATAQGPLAWMRFEADARFNNNWSLALSVWPQGFDEVVGLSHAHGRDFRRV